MSTLNDQSADKASSAGASFADLPEELLVQIFNHLDIRSTESKDGVDQVSMDPRSFSLTNRACYRASLSGDGATILIKDPMTSFFKLSIADFDGFEQRDPIDSDFNICSKLTDDELMSRYRQTAASRAQTWIIPDTGYGYQTYRCLEFLTRGFWSCKLTKSDFPRHLVLNFSKIIGPETGKAVTGIYEAKTLKSAIELAQCQWKPEAHIHYYPPSSLIDPTWIEPSSPAARLSIHSTAEQIPVVAYYRSLEREWGYCPSISYYCQLPRFKTAASDITDTETDPSQAAQDLIAILKERSMQPSYERRTEVLCKIPVDDSAESQAFKEAFEADKEGLGEIMKEANFELSWNVKKTV